MSSIQNKEIKSRINIYITLKKKNISESLVKPERVDGLSDLNWTYNFLPLNLKKKT